jgi:hypothetical protein
MNATTRAAVSAILAADASIPKSDADRALAILDGQPSGPAPLGRVVRVPEACRLFGVTSKTLRLWMLGGRLVPVYGGQTRRKVGFTEESVRALLGGAK